jgi:predicted N-acetyltransferase YhbS
MTDQMDIHPASSDERLAAYRNVHDVWSGGSNLEEHLKRRVSSVQHNRAEWFVGTLQGEVVTSLGCFGMQFNVNGRSRKGISIGSVHTLARFRGLGFAPQLIEWTEAFQRESGAIISLLYSDIDPDYYQKLGYQLCPAWEGSVAQQNIFRGVTRPGGKLVPISLPEERQELEAMYDGYHSRFAISIARSSEYWAYLFKKSAGDELFWLQGSTGERLGFVRLSATDDKLKIRDWAFTERSGALLETLIKVVIAEAADRRVAGLFGWLPNIEQLQPLVTLKKRETEITMLKSLCADTILTDEMVSSAEYFQEMDHV